MNSTLCVLSISNGKSTGCKLSTALAFLLFSLGCKAQSTLEKIALQEHPAARVSIPVNEEGQAQGIFHIYGKKLQLKSGKTVDLTSTTKTAETIAQNFLQQQKSLLNVNDTSKELKLQLTTHDRFGGSHFRYKRYVHGIPLESVEVLVHLDVQNEITGINGYITPVPTELTQSVAMHLVQGKPQLTIDYILDVVATDLKVSVNQINVLTATPLVITKAPYVVWQVDVVLTKGMTRYIYRVADSPPGEILQKRMNIQS